MNRIYRSIWNEASRTFVAVAEKVRAKGKPASTQRGQEIEEALVTSAGAAAPQAVPPRSRVRPRALEQRFMFDAAAVSTAIDAAGEAVNHDVQADSGLSSVLDKIAQSVAQPRDSERVAEPVLVRTGDPSASGGRKEVVFVDSRVADYQTLIAGIGAGIEVRLIDGSQDGLAQLAAWAASNRDYDAIHILSHGSSGVLALGTTKLDLNALDARSDALGQLGNTLTANGDILLYGCNIADGEAGAQFLTRLAALTRADIAASDNKTGAAALAADWVLESRVGEIESSLKINAENWHDVMGTDFLNIYTSAAAAATDANNNTYLAGNLRAQTFDFGGQSLTFGESTGVWLAKYDYNNNLVWVKQWNSLKAHSSYGDNARALAIDGAGNVYLSMRVMGAGNGGSSNVGNDTFDADPGAGVSNVTTTSFNGAGMLVKLNASGDFQWSRQTGVSGDGGRIAIDGSNNVYYLGTYRDNASFGGVALGSGGSGTHHFIAKMNAAGSVLWTRTAFAGNDVNAFSDVTVDSAGKVYIAGYNGLSLTIDGVNYTTNWSSTEYDGLLWALNADGTTNYVRKISGSANERYTNVEVLADGNLLLSGVYLTGTDLDPSAGSTVPSNVGLTDFFLTKISQTGSLIWSITAGGTAADTAKRLFQATDGSIIVTGTFNNTITLGSYSLTSAGSTDAFIAKITNDGQVAWAYRLGSSGADDIIDVKPLSGTQFRVIATIRNTTDVDPGPGVVNATTSTAGVASVVAYTLDLSGAFATTASASDTTPPVFDVAPAASNVSTSTLTLSASIDEAGTLYYVVVPDGSPAPTAAQVKAGQNGSGGSAVTSGNSAVASSPFTGSFNVSGLSAGTAYDIYVVAQDDEGTPNLMASPVKVDVTTAGNPPVFSSAGAVNFAENAAGTVYDAELSSATGTVTFSLSGTDAAKFNINASTGVLTFKGAPDFEQPTDVGANNVYNVTVRASDNNGYTDKAVAITVTNASDVNFTAADSSAISNNALVKSVTAGQTANITFSAASFLDYYAPNATAGFPGGLYAYSGTGSEQELIITAQAGYTFDLASFKFAPDFSQGTNAVKVRFTSGGNTYEDTYVLSSNGQSGYYNLVIPATHAVNDVTEVRIWAASYGEFQDIEISDIKLSDTTAPTVSSVTLTAATGAANNTLNAGDVLTATVTMSEATTVTGTPQLALNIGGTTVQANYASGSGSSALTFTYTIQSGQTDLNGVSIAANALTLNGGTLKDAAGNDATLTFAAVADNASYKVDTTAPVESGSASSNLAQTTATIASTSDEAGTMYYVVTTSATPPSAAQVMAGQSNTGAVATKSGSDAVVAATSKSFNLTGLTAATQYHAYFVTVDAAGNPSSVATASFTTAAPNVAPTLTTVGTVTGGNEDSEQTITFANLVAAGNEADSDGTVEAFVVRAVSTGTLRIGTSAGTATAWAAGSNDTIDGSRQAYWVPASNANGNLNAFTVVAKDNAGAESSAAVQVAVAVTAVNDAPTDIALSATAINQSAATPAATIATVSGADPENDALTFTLVSGANATDNSKFVIDGTTLKVGADALAAGSYSIRLRATDNGTGNLVYEEVFTITVADNVGPSLASSTPADNASGIAPSANISVTFNETVVAGTGSITLYNVTTGATVETFNIATGVGSAGGTASIAGSTLTLNPSANLAEATQYAIRVDGTAIKDVANNAFAGIADNTTLNFTTGVSDSAAPLIQSIQRQTPAGEASNAASLVYTVRFNEAVTAADSNDFQLTSTGTASGTISSVSGSGTDTLTITVSSVSGTGTLGISLKNTQNITDIAGNALATAEPADDELYAVDRNAPTLLSINRVGGESSQGGSVQFLVVFSEPVSNADVADFALQLGGTASGTISSISGSGTPVLTVTVSNVAGNGVLGLGLANGYSISDAVGNALASSTPGTGVAESFVIDSVAPLVTSITRTADSLTTADSVSFDVSFSEATSGVDLSDFSLVTSGTVAGTLSAISGSNGHYRVTVSGISGNGTLGLTFAGGQNITDANGNALTATTPTLGEAYTIDNAAPTVSAINRAGVNQIVAGTSTTAVFTVVFSEVVSGVSAADFTVTGTAANTGISSVSSSDGKTFHVTVGGVNGSSGQTVGLNFSGTVSDRVSQSGSTAFSAGQVYTVGNLLLNEGAIDQAALDALLGVNRDGVQKLVSSSAPVTQVIIIDSRLPGLAQQLSNLAAGTEVWLLDGTSSATAQITQILAQYHNLAAVHLLSHGSEGALYLGAETLSAANLAAQQTTLAAWGSALSASGDFLLYGCDVAKGTTGTEFINAFAAATQADVAASTDLTGASWLGGDWVLEMKAGQVDSVAMSLSAYDALLATPTNGNTTFNNVPAGYTEYARSTTANSTGISALNIAGSGWDVVGYGSGDNQSFVIASETWGPTKLIYIAHDGGPESITSLAFKSNDGKMFDLDSLTMAFNSLGGSTDPIDFTITGYLGATVTYTTVASGLLNDAVFKTFSSLGFIGIDKFVITPNTPGLLSALDIDTINATNFRNAVSAPVVTLSVSNSSISETGGSTTITATLDKVAATDTVVTLTPTGTASGSDYSLSSTTITILAGQTTGTATLSATADTLDEADETIVLDITSVTGGDNATENGTQQVTVTVLDDDAAPGISIADASVTEGNSGTSTLSFTVSLSAASGKTVSVNYASSNGTATAGVDYTAASGTLTFAPGETSKTITLNVAGDTTQESNETVNVTLTSPSNGTLTDASAVGTILDDENANPTISDVSNQTISEGGATSALAVTIGDTETAASSLTLTGSSSNTTLIPNGNIVISGSGANRTVTITPAANQTGSATITLTVSDGNGGTATDTFTVTVSDVNPVLSNATASVDENAGSGTAVTTVTASGDTNGLVYSITGGTGSSLFDINSSTGAITVKNGAVLNYEAASQFTLTVAVDDEDADTTADSTATLTINLNNLNEAPTDIALTATAFTNTQATAGATLATISGTDPDNTAPNNTLTYALVSGTGDTNNAAFVVDGSSLKVASGSALAAGSYSVRLRVSDGGSLSYEKAFSITVTDPLPTLVSASPLDNSTGVAVSSHIVLTFSEAITLGSGNIVLYDITGNGANSITIDVANHAGQLSINGSTLTINPSADLRAANQYAVQIASTALRDSSSQAYAGIADMTSLNFTTGTTDTQAPIATIIDLADPSATHAGTASIRFSEQVQNVDISDFTLTRDGQSVDISSLSVGGSGASYTLDLSTVTTVAGTYVLTLNTSNITDTSGNALAAAVSDTFVIDKTAPTAAAIVRASATPTNSGSLNFTVVFTEAVSGVDSSDFTLTGTASSGASIASVTRVSDSVYTVAVTGASGNGTLGLNLKSSGTGIADLAGNAISGGATGQLYTLDNTAPSVVGISRTGAQYTSGGSVSFTVTFDGDVSGVSAGDFTLSKGNGVVASDNDITVTGSGSSYTVTVANVSGNGLLGLQLKSSGTGISDRAGNAISAGFSSGAEYVVDQTSPVVTANQAFTLPENMASGFVIGQVLASDANRISGYQITAGDSAGYFSIDADGVITLTAAGAADGAPSRDYETTPNSFSLTVQATDIAGNTHSRVVTISVLNAIEDITPPTASIVVADTALSVGETSQVTITFSEAVTGFTNADLTVANGTLSAVSSSDGGTTWTATFTPTANLTSTSNVITLANSGVTDAAGNAGSGTTNSNNYAIDTLRPTLNSVTVSDTALQVGDTATVTFTFSEAVSGFTAADVTVPNGTLSNLASSDGGITWTATLTPNSGVTAATNALSVNLAGVNDAAGNAGSGSTASGNIAIDTARPTLNSVTVSDTALQVGDTATVTFTFSEAVSGFTAADVTVPNGTLSNLASSDGGITWTATLTPNSGVTAATNALSVNLAGVNDAAGNTGSGTSSSGNIAIDTARPTLNSVTVSDSALQVGDTATVTFTFSEAVTGFTAADVTVPNGTLSNLASSDGGITWTATLTPNSGVTAATNALSVNLAGVNDAAGNTGSGTSNSGNIAIDTARPTLNSVTVSDSALQVGDTATVTFTFSEAVSGFTAADVTVPNGTLSNLASSDGGITWTATLTPNSGVTVATNALSVNLAGVNDAAGNTGSGTSNSGNIAIDTARPTLNSVTVSDTALQVGDTATVTFTFSEAVTGFTAADVTVPNGTLSNLASSDGGITWTATLTPNSGVTVATNALSVNLAGVNDAAGNTGSGTSSSGNIAIDTARPTLNSVTVSDSALQVGDTATVTFTFSEAVSGFTAADVTVPNGTLSNLASSDGGITWTATLTPNSGVTVATNALSVNLAGVNDAAGNTGSGTSSSGNIAIDTARPTLNSVTVSDTALQVGDTATVTFTFSEAVTGFTAADVTVPNGTLSNLASSDGGITWTATLTPNSGVTVATNALSVNLAGVNDAAGNTGSGTSSSGNIAIDTARPTLNSVTVSDSALQVGDTATVTFTFSEAVSGFTAADVTVPNGTLSNLASSDGGITWTATLTPNSGVTAATNALSVNLAGVNDAAGNTGSGTSSSGNIAIDTARPTLNSVTVSDTALQVGDTATVTFTFSEAVTGFTAADVTVPNGTLSNLASSDGGITWTATLTPNSGVTAATNALSVNLAGVNDAAGNAGSGTSSSGNLAIDTARPMLSVSLSSSTLLPNQTAVVTFTFSEPPLGFGLEDVQASGGTLSELRQGESANIWLATFTPTPGITVNGNAITVPGGWTDLAGNTQLATVQSDNYVVNTFVENSKPVDTTVETPVQPVVVEVVPPAPTGDSGSEFVQSPAVVEITSVLSPAIAQIAQLVPVVAAESGSGQAIGVQPDLALTQSRAGAFQVLVLPRTGGDDNLSVNNPLRDQSVPQGGGEQQIALPADLFAHTNPNETVVLLATQVDGQPLPAWVQFDPLTGKLIVDADKAPPGEVVVKVIARDSQNREAVTTFKLLVGSPRAELERKVAEGKTTLSAQLQLASRAQQQTILEKIASGLGRLVKLG